MKLIGLVGSIGSGKDTAADILVNTHYFYRESFAGVLKDVVSVVFGWDRTLLEGRSDYARQWREQVDPWWAERLKNSQLNPRWVLQQWGTEVCRQHFHDDIWVASLENKLRKLNQGVIPPTDIVISDVRFPNEIKAIQNQGGIIIQVERGECPVWYEWAKKFNNADHGTQRTMRIVADLEESQFRYKIHPSEWAWIGCDIDYKIDNNGSLQDLYEQIRSILMFETTY
jgi:hypothetical protein